MSIVKGFQITASLGEFGEWETVDSPELDITMDDYYPPSSRTPVKIPSIGKYADIQLGRAYDPNKDGPVESWVKDFLNGLQGSRNMTIHITNDQNAVQASKTYVVKPQGTKPPAGKAGDGAVAMFMLKLAVESQVA